MTISLQRLNALPAAEAQARFLDCCGSTRWARAMTEGRPFQSVGALLERGDQLWLAATPDDWEEAFARHPRIGERATQGSSTARAWSANEQLQAANTAVDLAAALAKPNAEYERRFGRTYIICANDRTAAEILTNLNARLSNDPDRERAVAAEEQRKITRLRLEKLCPG